MFMYTVNKIVLLLTASIDTRGCDNSMFEATERQAQYSNSLDYYISKLSYNGGVFDKIVFCENSGWNLDLLRERSSNLPSGLVEYLELDPSEYLPEKGKSYNEMLMIDQALSTLKNLGDNELIIKATGRYKIINAIDLISFISHNDDRALFHCNYMREVNPLKRKYQKNLVDTRFFAFRKSIWDLHFAGLYTLAGNKLGVHFETIAYSIAKNNEISTGWYTSFDQPLRIIGIQGHWKYILGHKIPKKYEPIYNSVRYYIEAIGYLINRAR
jgi:hypothetical protein